MICKKGRTTVSYVLKDENELNFGIDEKISWMCFWTWDSFSEVCIPYSEKACLESITNLGLSQGGNGYSFSGDYATKGCYARVSGSNANMAFYGTGGTDDEMKNTLASPQYRPKGYDCVTQGTFISRKSYNSQFQHDL